MSKFVGFPTAHVWGANVGCPEIRWFRAVGDVAKKVVGNMATGLGLGKNIVLLADPSDEKSVFIWSVDEPDFESELESVACDGDCEWCSHSQDCKR